MNIWVELLSALVRAVVQALVGALVTHGIITASQAGHFTTELTLSIVAGVVLFVGTYGASAWNKIKAKNRIIAALQSPPNTPVAEVVAAADSASAGEKIVIATSPGNVALPGGAPK